MKSVLLDTSFLVACVEAKIDFLSFFEQLGLQPEMLEQVVEELKMLKSRTGSISRSARLALDLTVHLPVIRHKGRADDLVVEHASKNRLAATMDAELKRRLKERGIPHFVVRQKQFIAKVNV